MHHGQTFVEGVVGVYDVHLFPVQVDLPLIHLINSEQAFHQRGFAGAVLTHQSVYGARPDFQADPVQSLDAGEAFADTPHFQSVLCHPVISFHKIRCAGQTHLKSFYSANRLFHDIEDLLRVLVGNLYIVNHVYIRNILAV